MDHEHVAHALGQTGSFFMPHGHCYLWTPGILWMEVISNALIALAYYSIPLGLYLLVRARKDIPYPHLFVLFGLFITSCGTGHLIDIVTIWQPIYWTKALWDSVTGLVSVATAFVLGPLIPRLLASSTIQEYVQVQTIGTLEAQKTQLESVNARLAETNRELEAQMTSLQRATALLAERETRIRELREELDQLRTERA
jgi:hypothetical protein